MITLVYYVALHERGILGEYTLLEDRTLLFLLGIIFDRDKLLFDRANISYGDLVLFKPRYLSRKPDDDLLIRTKINIAGQNACDNSETVGDVFAGDDLNRNFVHIVVSIQQRVATPPSPLPEKYSRREATVSGIWNKLEKYKFIWVRGTPASGKSVLSMLLRIHAHHVFPSANVKRLVGWDEHNRSLWNTFTAELEVANPSRPPSIWIIDEAQLTYSDVPFWDFLKNIDAYPDVYVIGFAAFGSVRDLKVRGTPANIDVKQRISLQPIDRGDGTPAIGLLFTAEDLADVVQRRYSRFGGHRFDGSFLDGLLEVSGGHIGAIVYILVKVESLDEYRFSVGTSKRIGWDAFSKNFPATKFAEDMATSGTVFHRSLPGDDDLKDRSISLALSLVARKTLVVDKEVDQATGKTFKKCMRRGWLHNDSLDSKVVYFFASPLHHWFVQWKLFMEMSEKPVIEGKLIDFVIGVIGCFNPLVLSEKRKIRTGTYQRQPEAQYQDEFYRCSHDYSRGSLVIFPEFGTKSGRVDFYVPSKQWAIELLRDGDHLDEHCERFAPSGAYQGLRVEAHVILDCRSTMPRKTHPKLPHLYHVVFEDDFKYVTVLNHMKEEVQEKFRLTR